MTKSPCPIIVVAFNRADSLTRLLDSLLRAYYESSEIPLIISIDKCESNQDVLKIANEFSWPHGEKEILYNETNLGLRKHIIKCGLLSNKYGKVLILEDDLYVSSCFYEYAIQALSFVGDNSKIGGISLYNHQLNVHKGVNFSPLEDGFDNWYFQFASSWGQVWTQDQFNSFLEWYNANPNISNFKNVPAYVLSWSDKSWLKYYICYLVENNKYFIYPKISLTTNFSDAGTHVGNDSTAYQVPLLQAKSKNFRFSTIEESKGIYNAFFENELLYSHYKLNKEELCIDLYGYQKNYIQRYILTSKILDYKIISCYAKSLKPIECNVLENIKGNEIFLYDSQISKHNKLKVNRRRDLLYHVKYISHINSLFLAIDLSKNRLTGIIKKVFKK